MFKFIDFFTVSIVDFGYGLVWWGAICKVVWGIKLLFGVTIVNFEQIWHNFKI